MRIMGPVILRVLRWTEVYTSSWGQVSIVFVLVWITSKRIKSDSGPVAQLSSLLGNDISVFRPLRQVGDLQKGPYYFLWNKTSVLLCIENSNQPLEITRYWFNRNHVPLRLINPKLITSKSTVGSRKHVKKLDRAETQKSCSLFYVDLPSFSLSRC